MRILSIDPGFDKLGYAFFDKNGSEHTYIFSGLIQTDKAFNHEYRVEKIYSQLQSLIKVNKPELVVLEQLFFFKNAKTVIKVAQSQGIILLLAGQEKIPVKFLTPLQIKQIITGYGNADKKSVVKMLSLIMKDKLPKCEDDQSDAIACGLAYCYLNENLVQ
jgi:crossover junction endodeoxyribonuclease RuvC